MVVVLLYLDMSMPLPPPPSSPLLLLYCCYDDSVMSYYSWPILLFLPAFLFSSHNCCILSTFDDRLTVLSLLCADKWSSYNVHPVWILLPYRLIPFNSGDHPLQSHFLKYGKKSNGEHWMEKHHESNWIQPTSIVHVSNACKKACRLELCQTIIPQGSVHSCSLFLPEVLHVMLLKIWIHFLVIPKTSKKYWR